MGMTDAPHGWQSQGSMTGVPQGWQNQGSMTGGGSMTDAPQGWQNRNMIPNHHQNAPMPRYQRQTFLNYIIPRILFIVAVTIVMSFWGFWNSPGKTMTDKLSYYWYNELGKKDTKAKEALASDSNQNQNSEVNNNED